MIKGYYINLDSRLDRMNHMVDLKVKYPFFKNVERIQAISNQNGALGCALSHIMVLEKFLESKDDVFMVLEDDLCILNDTNYNNFIYYFDKIKDNPDWDIIVLTPRGDKREINNSNNNINLNMNYMNSNHFNLIKNNQTTTGYIVRRRFINILIENFKESVKGLICKSNPNIFALDQYWKRLQDKYNFYYFNNIFAGQLVGYSDIENKNVNYNDRFIIQK
jgi:glycosyl transferase family 25